MQTVGPLRPGQHASFSSCGSGRTTLLIGAVAVIPGCALTATVLLGVVHAFWHLPAFFYKDAYRSMGLAAGLPMLVLSVVAAAITFTWLYNSTRGSILIVALFHALFDWLSVSKAGGAMAPAVMSGVVWVLAVILVIVYKAANLSRPEKQVA